MPTLEQMLEASVHLQRARPDVLKQLHRFEEKRGESLSSEDKLIWVELYSMSDRASGEFQNPRPTGAYDGKIETLKTWLSFAEDEDLPEGLELIEKEIETRRRVLANKQALLGKPKRQRRKKDA